MKKENIVDVETGLATVAFLENSMNAELQRLKRTGLEFCFALMQIDNEDELRGMLGKKMDRLSGEVARLAIACKREIDVAALLPTGEMAFVLPITPVEGALVFTRKIQARVLAKIKVSFEGREVRPTASFGVTLASGRGELTGETLLKRARRALRTAAQEGGGSTHVDVGDDLGAGLLDV
jgi:diguanylate cyclase (GGDEF)-like protein